MPASLANNRSVARQVTLTAIALVACGFGLCVTPQAASSLKLPGVVYRPVKASPPPKIDLVCLYRRNDESPILAAFLEIVRKFKVVDME